MNEAPNIPGPPPSNDQQQLGGLGPPPTHTPPPTPPSNYLQPLGGGPIIIIISQPHDTLGRVHTTESFDEHDSSALGRKHSRRPHRQPTARASTMEYQVVAEEFLSDAMLRRLAGREDLESTHFLEMTADTSDQTLGDLGHRLPALEQLKLSNSNISTLRDLGTALKELQARPRAATQPSLPARAPLPRFSPGPATRARARLLSHAHRLMCNSLPFPKPSAQVLWIARSNLREMEGLGAFDNLRELYAAFNDITDLSPLMNAERLQVLDLEANAIDDAGQVHYLTDCTELTVLTLQDNPFADDDDYRAQVRALLPNLTLLDDEPFDEEGEGAEEGSVGVSEPRSPPTAATPHPVPAAAASFSIREGSDTAAATALASPSGAGAAGTAAQLSPLSPLAQSRRELALLRDAIKYTDSLRAFDVMSCEALACIGGGGGGTAGGSAGAPLRPHTAATCASRSWSAAGGGGSGGVAGGGGGVLETRPLSGGGGSRLGSAAARGGGSPNTRYVAAGGAVGLSEFRAQLAARPGSSHGLKQAMGRGGSAGGGGGGSRGATACSSSSYGGGGLSGTASRATTASFTSFASSSRLASRDAATASSTSSAAAAAAAVAMGGGGGGGGCDEDAASSLTFGHDGVICGNPIQALRRKRAPPPASSLTPDELREQQAEAEADAAAEAALSAEERALREREDLLQELWQFKLHQAIRSGGDDDDADADAAAADPAADAELSNAAADAAPPQPPAPPTHTQAHSRGSPPHRRSDRASAARGAAAAAAATAGCDASWPLEPCAASGGVGGGADGAADILILDGANATPTTLTPREVAGSVQQPACRCIPSSGSSSGGANGGASGDALGGAGGGLRPSRSKLRLAQTVGSRRARDIGLSAD